MKNLIKNLFLFVLVASAASCDVGDDEELDYGSGSYVAQFPYASRTGFFFKDDADIYNYEIPVELVGGNGLALDNDVTLSYSVSSTSTAVEGVNFDFVTPGGTVVIPAGSTFASIPITVYSGTLDDQNPPIVVLDLVEVSAAETNTDIVTSGNKGTIAITLQGTCASDLAGMYNLVVTTATGGTFTMPGELVVQQAAGVYLTDSTGPYNNRGLISAGAQLGTASAGFVFNEVCGRIALAPDQNLGGALGGGYSNSVYQTAAQYAASFVNPETGVMTIKYSVFFAAGDATYTGVYTPVQ